MTTIARDAPARRGHVLGPGIAALWGRVRPGLILILPIALACMALSLTALGIAAARDDRRIADLAAGRDVPVAPQDRAALVAARIGFLASRDRLGETEPLIDALDRADATAAAAQARYVVGNARLRQAFRLIGGGDLDRAAPLVTLARQDYRRALQARPDFWDAKYNLDVASRLVRDYPEFDRKTGDELRAEPKKIWTDIPGQPRGGP